MHDAAVAAGMVRLDMSEMCGDGCSRGAMLVGYRDTGAGGRGGAGERSERELGGALSLTAAAQRRQRWGRTGSLGVVQPYPLRATGLLLGAVDGAGACLTVTSSCALVANV